MKASDNSQKYKEGEPIRGCNANIPTLLDAGKYLLERERLVKDNAWKLDDEE